MKKIFLLIQVGQKFKYGGVGFVRTDLGYCGPFMSNARLDKPGPVVETDHYYFTRDDEVEV